MFDSDGPLLATMRDAQREERSAAARKMIAAGRLFLQRRAALGGEHDSWCVDDWDVIAAEVAAELGVSRGRASSWMDHGHVLIERLPALAEEFVAGEIDFRIIRIVGFRTALLTDEQAIAAIDEMLAYKTPSWNTLSDKRVAELVDWMVLDLDPDALRVAKQRDDDRHVEVTADHSGMAEISGRVRATDGAAFNLKLDELAATVCRDDPRTKRQRRADALMALVSGAAGMACLCESTCCPAAGNGSTSPPVVIHVIAETTTIEGRGTKSGFVPGYGPLPPAMVREVAKAAQLKPVRVPNDAVKEPQYRPSAALALFVRSRDLTCRWMGCDKPAWQADIDHTVPYPLGPTHPSNNSCFCRFHHLLKTFHCGPGGWKVNQLADGTMVFTSPSGRVHTTEPLGAMLFPVLAAPTVDLVLGDEPPPGPNRGLAMPKRKRTRAQDRAHRIEWERGVNRARYRAIPPPF
ncbi:13E12 repeat family protein [Mycobacterium sp. NPDC051804]|uniref:13E12 repeat family protein n=1 Tax=Mycobacterium sp. NPDC051804 TaxID=3364295 RepID=UPI00379C0489